MDGEIMIPVKFKDKMSRDCPIRAIPIIKDRRGAKKGIKKFIKIINEMDLRNELQQLLWMIAIFGLFATKHYFIGGLFTGLICLNTVLENRKEKG